jgi:xanthine dehydrogenase accessory factor
MRDAIDMIGTGKYKIVFIDMTGEVAQEEGMVCGGTMKVLIEDGAYINE